jgi:hypothetical protein
MSGDSDDEIEPGTLGLFGVPKGWKPHGKSGPMLRGAKGHWMGPMREVESGLVPLHQLDAIYEAVSGASLRPGVYFFNWLIDCFGYLTDEVSEIKKHVAETNRRLAGLIDGVQELQAWKDAQLSADIEFVRHNLLLALSQPLVDAREHIRLVYSNADQTLRRLQRLIKVSLGVLGKSDPRRILFLDQLATFVGYQSMILLLMGFTGKAAENLDKVRTIIEQEAAGLLADWTDGVDLREAVPDKIGLGKLLAVMETIAPKPPSDRLLDAYWSMPRLPAHLPFFNCTNITETGPYKATPEWLALVDRTLPVLDGRRGDNIFVRRGQIFDQYYDDSMNKVVVIPENDGYLIEWSNETPRFHRLLAVKTPKLPIEDLARHVERLAEIVENARNICKRAGFAGEHPELAHELARLCLKRPEAQDGVILCIPWPVPENTTE